MFIVKINTDNAAFYDNDGQPAPEMELARILRDLAQDIEESSVPLDLDLRDYNGHKVGTLKFR